jgi:hypothetical protein
LCRLHRPSRKLCHNSCPTEPRPRRQLIAAVAIASLASLLLLSRLGIRNKTSHLLKELGSAIARRRLRLFSATIRRSFHISTTWPRTMAAHWIAKTAMPARRKPAGYSHSLPRLRPDSSMATLIACVAFCTAASPHSLGTGHNDIGDVAEPTFNEYPPPPELDNAAISRRYSLAAKATLETCMVLHRLDRFWRTFRKHANMSLVESRLNGGGGRFVQLFLNWSL